jgi:hypothetical protein
LLIHRAFGADAAAKIQYRYYGILAPASSLRRYIFPQDKSEIEPAHPNCVAKAEASATEEVEAKPRRSKKPKNYSWAQLLKWVFEAGVLIFPQVCSPDLFLPYRIEMLIKYPGRETRAHLWFISGPSGTASWQFSIVVR